MKGYQGIEEQEYEEEYRGKHYSCECGAKHIISPTFDIVFDHSSFNVYHFCEKCKGENYIIFSPGDVIRLFETLREIDEAKMEELTKMYSYQNLKCLEVEAEMKKQEEERVKELKTWIKENTGKPNPSCWQCVNTVDLEYKINETFNVGE